MNTVTALRPAAQEIDSNAQNHRPASHRRTPRTLARLAVLLVMIVGVLLTGVGGASATVLSGAGGKAFPVTKCHGLGTGSAEISAHIVQDYAGQPVAARLWIHDSRGWRQTAWATRTNPGWSYDGAVWFTGYFTGLRGTAVAYLEYGWYRSGRWVTGSEYPRYYSSLFGGNYTTCLV